MIETKPAPNALTVWSLMRGQTVLDVDLAAPWKRNGDTPFWLSRSSWGMAAMVDALAEAHKCPINVWIPEYFCDQAIWPMRQRAAVLHFYPVDREARPDWSRIELRGPGPTVFFLVHFFGHPSDGVRARQVCDAANALMVEDATQALGPAPGIGETGDLVFYSPWKFFEVPNGSLMLIWPRAGTWVEAISRAVEALGDKVAPGLQWARDAAISKIPRSDRRSRSFDGSVHGFFRDAATVPISKRPKASPVSKPILATIDIADVGRKRRENNSAIRAFFDGLPGWEPLVADPAQGPLRSVFRLDTPQRASDAHDALRRVGVVAEGWPTLPPEVDEADAQAAVLRRTVLNLPCHQGLTPSILVEALQEAETQMRTLKRFIRLSNRLRP